MRCLPCLKVARRRAHPRCLATRVFANLSETLLSVIYCTLKNDDFQPQQQLTSLMRAIAVVCHNLLNNSHRRQLRSLVNYDTANIRKTCSWVLKGRDVCRNVITGHRLSVKCSRQENKLHARNKEQHNSLCIDWAGSRKRPHKFHWKCQRRKAFRRRGESAS